MGSINKICLFAVCIATYFSTVHTSFGLDKNGCGKKYHCFRYPSTCETSYDCEYFLKFLVTPIQLSIEISSNKYDWVSVGFNDKKAMINGEAFVFESDPSKLKYYRLTKYSRPTGGKVKDVDESVVISNVIFCKFKKSIDVSDGSLYDLSVPRYFLYAAGFMDKRKKPHVLDKHQFFTTSSRPINLSVIADTSSSSGVDKPSQSPSSSPVEKRISTMECGSSKTCFRNPKGCSSNQDCDYLVTVEKKNKELEFSLSGKSEGWVAVGFNRKPRMGGTQSIICRRTGNTFDVNVRTAKLKYSAPTLIKDKDISLLGNKYEGGFIFCKFSTPIQMNGGFDLSQPKYLIFAKGTGTSDKINEHHGSGSKGCSNEMVDVSMNKDYQLGDCHDSDLPKAHGSIMIFTWLFLVITAAFIARYTRNLWKPSKIMEIDLWFLVHRLVVAVAMLLFITSIIMIFVHVAGWTKVANTHAVLGIMVLILATIQPTIALIRPHPNSTKRWIFTWSHRFLAILLFILTVAAIFKGVEQFEDEGGEVAKKVLISLLVILLITVVIMEVLAFRIRIQMSVSGDTDGSFKYWEVKAQYLVLCLFSVILLILVVIMIASVAGGGFDKDDDDD